MEKEELRKQLKRSKKNARRLHLLLDRIFRMDLAQLKGAQAALNGKRISDNPYTGIARREMWDNAFKNQTMSVLGNDALLAVIKLHRVMDDLNRTPLEVLDGVIRFALSREEEDKEEAEDEEDRDETPTKQEPEAEARPSAVHPSYHDHCD